MANELSVPNQNLPSVNDDLAGQLTALGASASLVKRAVKAHSNLALMETPRLPRIKATSDGLLLDASNPDEEELKELSGVIIFGAKYKAWYKEKFDPQVKNPPDCFSHDAKFPSPDASDPQAKSCKGCPKNEFETADVGKGKACRDMRRLFLLLDVKQGEESIMPIQLNVTPTSLKAFDDYLGKLVMNGFSIEEVETKVTAKKKSRDDKYVVLSFAKTTSYADDEATLGNIRALKKLWLPHMEKSHVEQDELETEAPQPQAAAGGASKEF